MTNKLIIAAAGSGKTTFLIEEALRNVNSNILITTYTENNETEIKRKFFEKQGFLPKNITVQTWFSFLLQHGVRPYQGYLYEPDIKGMILVNSLSALRSKETDIQKHYLTDDQKIYSDKIAKFVFNCNKKSSGIVIKRLQKIYTHIFIDEVQDLAGYDLEVLKLLFDSKINMLLVGDPRQGTYATNNATKNKKFRQSQIMHFFEDKSIDIETDKTSLMINYRCTSTICELSNFLYSDQGKTTSGNYNITDHDGIFLVARQDVIKYLEKYEPIQLRDSTKTKIEDGYEALNFGQSKGLSFERVLIYPTEPIKKWLQNHDSELALKSRAKLYVAITRARQSVAFVFDYNEKTVIKNTQKWLS